MWAAVERETHRHNEGRARCTKQFPFPPGTDHHTFQVLQAVLYGGSECVWGGVGRGRGKAVPGAPNRYAGGVGEGPPRAGLCVLGGTLGHGPSGRGYKSGQAPPANFDLDPNGHAPLVHTRGLVPRAVPCLGGGGGVSLSFPVWRGSSPVPESRGQGAGWPPGFHLAGEVVPGGCRGCSVACTTSGHAGWRTHSGSFCPWTW